MKRPSISAFTKTVCLFVSGFHYIRGSDADALYWLVFAIFWWLVDWRNGD